TAVLETLQPAFEVTIPFQRRVGGQFDQVSREAGVIRRTDQLAIQTGRRNLEQIGPTRNHILNIENRPHLTAHVGAIVVGDTTWFVNEHPQHACFAAAAELYVHYFQPAGRRHTFYDGAYLINVQRHESTGFRGFRFRHRTGQNTFKQKVGLRPLVCFAKTVLHNSNSTNMIPRSGAKDKPSDRLSRSPGSARNQRTVSYLMPSNPK